MIDFNTGSGYRPGQPIPIDQQIAQRIDAALIAANKAEPARSYLGASALGGPCARAIYYDMLPERPPITQHAWQEFWDENEDDPFDGRTLRIFAIGHMMEDLAASWIQAAGFDLITRNHDGRQFRVEHPTHPIAGHLDGEIIHGPAIEGLEYPIVWDCKSAKNKKWSEYVKHGLREKAPTYYTQMNIYCHYRRRKSWMLTAVNKDTAELKHFIEPYDEAHALDMIRRAGTVMEAVARRDPPDRISQRPDWFQCRMCRYVDYCHGVDR